MKLNTNAGLRTNRNVLRRGGTIQSALHGSGRPSLLFNPELYIERVATTRIMGAICVHLTVVKILV